MGAGSKRLLIDAGQGEPLYLQNLRTVVSEVLRIDGFQAIVLTHSHVDHIGGVEDVLRTWGPMPVFKFREAGEPESLQRYIQPLVDGQEISTPGATLRAIHAPGHKADHLCFYFPQENALFTGDIVLGRGSVIPTQTFIDNYVDYKASMRKLQSLGAAKLYPSHGDMGVPGHKVRSRQIDADLKHRKDREDQVLAALKREAMQLPEIVTAVYGQLPDDLRKAASDPHAAMNTSHYLSELVRRGDVAQDSPLTWRTRL